MAVRFSIEQEDLRSTAAQIARAALIESPSVLAGANPPSAWDALVGASMLDLRLRDGGEPLAGTIEAALVAEAVGRYPSADTPLVASTLAVELLSLAGAAEEAGKVAAGTQRASVLLAPQLTRVAVVAGQTVSGVAWDAGSASRAYLVREAGEGLELAYVGLAGGGTQASPVDLTRPLVEVSDVVPTSVPGTALTRGQVARWTAFATTLVAADELGVMDAAVSLMAEHARSREQFGKAVGAFQAVSHRIADAYVSLEGARSIVWYAAWAADNLDPDEAGAAARRAKAYTATVARTSCEDLIQVLGGIGMSWEHVAHLYLRRSMLNRQTLGDEHYHYAALSDLLVEV